MRKFTNVQNIPLALAVFLATDNYDHDPDPKTISATSLIKPIRELILSERVEEKHTVTDIASAIHSSFGTALHDGIEQAWCNNYQTAMKDLGYPDSVIDAIVINPPEDQPLAPDVSPVYLEQRRYRDLDGFRISGKFDMIADGELKDFKSTTVYTYIHKTKEEAYQLQGSIYRWICPELLTSDFIEINYIFRNWEGYKTSDKNYPPRQLMAQRIPLLSLADTERYIKDKLREYVKLHGAPQSEIPLCTPKQLWQSASHWKYYKNPDNRKRSTKNFNTLQDALIRNSADGNVGVVIEKQGDVSACKFCNAFSVCEQKDELIANGLLVL